MRIDITEKDGVVTVTDSRKSITFESDERTEVDPMEAAKLYAEYLSLLNTCPSAQKYTREEPNALSDESIATPGRNLSLKPKKITLRILEGEIVS